MFAVIRTGGKQYRVAPNDIIEVETIAGEPGETVELGEVLLLGGDKPETGSPLVSGATVAAEVIEQKRADKIRVFKKKRRSNYRRTAGHRQHLTALKITEILTGGKKPSKTAAKKADTSDKVTDKAEEKAPAKTAAKSKPAESKAADKKTQAKKADAKPAAKAKAPAKKAPTSKTADKDAKPAAKKAAEKKPAAKKAPAKEKAPAKKPAAKKSDS